VTSETLIRSRLPWHDRTPMKLLAIGRPRLEVNVATAFPPLARAELMVVLELYRAGVIREMYSRAEPGAVLVLETPTRRHRNRCAGPPAARGQRPRRIRIH
jgi:hypothetical protein